MKRVERILEVLLTPLDWAIDFVEWVLSWLIPLGWFLLHSGAWIVVIAVFLAGWSQIFDEIVKLPDTFARDWLIVIWSLAAPGAILLLWDRHRNQDLADRDKARQEGRRDAITAAKRGQIVLGGRGG
jgi:hypothetical protein